jgi:ataxia telangiectasia mutated family protein
MQAWIRHNSTSKLVSYILLLPDTQFLTSVIHLQGTQAISSICTRTDTRLDSIVLDYCISETNRSLEKFQDLIKERVHGISAPVVRLLTNQCLANDHIRAFCSDSTGQRKRELDKAAESLLTELTQYLARPDVENAKSELCLHSIASVIPSPAQITALMARGDFLQSQFDLMIKCSRVFEQHRSLQIAVLGGTTVGGTTVISMDIDDGFDSQSSQSKHQQVVFTLPRDFIATTYDVASFRRSLRCHLVFLACAIDGAAETGSLNFPPNFMSQLVELTPEDLCLAWGVLSKILTCPLEMTSSDLTSLFEHITDSFLTNYVFDRHEAALSAYLDMTTKFADRWLAQKDDGIGPMGREGCEWFIKLANSNAVSNLVECRMITLFFCLLGLRGPDFKPGQFKSGDLIPHLREILINFLDRDLPILFEMSHKLPTLFQHFTLGEHEGVFNSIFAKLPIDMDQPERMGVRLHIFSSLAAAWPTLLRRCVYHIFETAGKSPSTTAFATFSIKTVATALSVEDVQEIFVLFASQLLFTWLTENSVWSIPYSIFNYSSLDHLLRDVEDEITAQVYMGASETALAELSRLLNESESEMLASNFGRSAAYCLARDSEYKRKGNSSNALETKLQKTLGDKQYIQLFVSHYPQILANIFLLVDSGLEEKLLDVFNRSQKIDLKYAKEALLEMRDLSESLLLLPPDQQPSFHSAGLVESIYKISKRNGQSLGHLWSPKVYVYVLRSLLQKIHPSLGSLHACSVLRKVRVFISLAGKTALSGYPLEMTLHALRPFLTDKQCANDASGIVQYLLKSSMHALVEAVPFVSGFLASVLISLRKFASLTQDSTTQERDHQATVKRASNFREWLVQTWYNNFESLVNSNSIAKLHAAAFKTLINAALGAQSDANAGISTPESDLLRALLNQDKSSQKLLTKPSRNLTLNLLCNTFQSPQSYRDDMFGSDAQSTLFATEVWESCRGLDKVNNEYFLWAGKVLGRARISTNWAYTSRSHEADIRSMEANWEDEIDSFDFTRSSKTVALRALMHLLTSGNRNDVGLAEDTLREIMGKASQTSAIDGLVDEIPTQIAAALQFDTSTSAVPPTPLPVKPLQRVLSTKDSNAMDWVRDLAVSLVSGTNQAFLRPLARVLHGVSGFSEKLLAPVVHLLLIEDLDNDEEPFKHLLSTEFAKTFEAVTSETISHTRALLEVVLYLRQRPHPDAVPINSWGAWLNLEPVTVAKAAEKCGMHTAALLFAEMTSTETPARTTSQRRSTSQRAAVDAPKRTPTELLLSIYRSIDEPDSFYGVHQTTSLATVLQRLDYEDDGYKALMFHSARLDSDMRQQRNLQTLDTSGVIQALSRLNLSSVSHAVLRGFRSYGGSNNVLDGALQAARKLEQWDISAPDSSKSGPAVLFRVFQNINNAVDLPSVREVVNSTITDVVRSALHPDHDSKALQASLRILGVLTEVDEVMGANSFADVKDVLNRMRSRDASLANAR